MQAAKLPTNKTKDTKLCKNIAKTTEEIKTVTKSAILYKNCKTTKEKNESCPIYIIWK